MRVEIVELVNSVVVDASSVDVVEIGIAGPQGPPGVQGPPGGATASYVHTQASPASVWTIDHNLGFYPNVTVIDTLGRVVEGEEAYPTVNRVVLTFSAAFSGAAYVS